MPVFKRCFKARQLRAPQWFSAAFAGITAILATAAAAQSPGPPVLNTPYQCANGITYTVTVCKPFGATDQWCETIERQNGNLVTAMDSSWSSMTGRLKGCTLASAPASAPPSAPAGAGAQQTFNPAYLKEFPTVDQITAQISGTTPIDTANRQASAMHDFGLMINAFAGPRAAQQQFTPDEVRLISGYFTAYSILARTTATQPDQYVGNNDFTASLFRTFSMPTVQQKWIASNSQAPGQPGGSSAQTLPPTNDPAQIAIRRCFELGGTGLQCVGTGMSQGLQQLMGIDLGALTASGKTGLVVLGTFKSSSGLTFTFADGSVDIGNCGKMVQGAHNYTVSVSGEKWTIHVDNQPEAFVVTLGPDGTAVGPAAETITGQRVTGYEVVTNTRTGVQVSRTPVYGPITEHCTVGTLKPGPGVILDAGLSTTGSGVLSALGTVLSTMAGDPSSNDPNQFTIAPGPRVTGAFTSKGGLKIQFNDGNAVIDCAQAHVLARYDVSLQGGVAVVSVKSAGTNPFSLSLQSDGAFGVSQPVTVNGKLMTAMDDNANPIFTPTTATCAAGTLVAAK
ncbi:MAG TPA: hypothetical protein VMT38_02805 [Terracidiphilus sp.]|nr:hypothetical protein [Terracidiphilus sp.]